MGKLNEAMLQHMRHLVLAKNTCFSYRDFLHFRVDGKEYRIAHGTFRNKISNLKKTGQVELARSNSSPALYTLRGLGLGGQHDEKESTLAPVTVTDTTHIGSSVINPNCVITNSDITKMPIYRDIQKHPANQKGLHDIHLKFQVPDIYTILSSSPSSTYEPNPCNKGISVPPVITNNLRISSTVYPTDTVDVIAGCSNAPIAINTQDLIRLSNGLTRQEERLARIVDECGKTMPGGYESLIIPDHTRWNVTLWHFGTDSKNYREYTGEKYCVTWKAAENVLARIYNKNLKNIGIVRRLEIQESPQKAFADVIKENGLMRPE
jgi:hypothetical protein